MNRHSIFAGHPNALEVGPAPVVTGGPLGTSSDAAGGDLKRGAAVVVILIVQSPAVAADGVHAGGLRMDEGVGGLAGAGGQAPPLHHEIAIAPGVHLGVGPGEVHVLPVEFLQAGFPLGQGWQWPQQDHHKEQHCAGSHLSHRVEFTESLGPFAFSSCLQNKMVLSKQSFLLWRSCFVDTVK